MSGLNRDSVTLQLGIPAVTMTPAPLSQLQTQTLQLWRGRDGGHGAQPLRAGAVQAGDGSGGCSSAARSRLVRCPQVECLQPQVTPAQQRMQAPPSAGPHLHRVTAGTRESHLPLPPSARLEGGARMLAAGPFGDIG